MINTPKLLISEPPLQVLPTLAVQIGLNQAILLQQLHYWLIRSTNIKEGHHWSYQSLTDWQEQFPFWSESTIKRTISPLERDGIVISGCFNKRKGDKTKWYRINYDHELFAGCGSLAQVTTPSGQSDHTMGSPNTPSGQSDPTIGSHCTDQQVNMNRPLPETTPETTTNIKEAFDEKDFLNAFNEATGRRVTAFGPKAKRQYNALLKIGHSQEDIIAAAKSCSENEFFQKKCNRKYLTPEYITRADKFTVYFDDKPETNQKHSSSRAEAADV